MNSAINRLKQLKRQTDNLLEGTTIYSSGYLMEEPHALEVTLTGRPAVANAMWRVIRSQTAEGKPKFQTPTIPINTKKDAKRQVFGYVSVPWLEDSYGDILDPKSIEQAAHSFLHNLITRQVEGVTGIGEEHILFYQKAYPIQSVIDYSGQIGGIPGGWWLGTQIEDPVVWEKVLKGEYAGYSLGSMVFYTQTKDATFQENTFKKIPNLATLSTTTPSKGKLGMMAEAGLYGYPGDKSSYADPINLKFPIDTLARTFATMRHVIDEYSAEGYSKSELKFMLNRMVASLVRFEVEVPDSVKNQVGIKSQKSLKDSVCSVIRGLSSTVISTNSNDTEEVEEMDRTEILDLVKQNVETVVSEQMKLQSEVLKEDLTNEMKTQMDTGFTDFTATMQGTLDSIKTLVESAQASKEQAEVDAQKTVEEKTQAETTALIVAETLRSMGLVKEDKKQSAEEGEPLDLNATLASLKQQMDDLTKVTSGRQTARKSVTAEIGALTATQRAELAQRRKEAPFDDDPCFMPGFDPNALVDESTEVTE